MRQIHQLAQVLALVLFNKRENPEIEINEVISRGLQDSLGITLDELLDLNKSQVLALCHKEGRFQPDFAVSLADLLMEESSETALEHATWLYSAALEAGGTLPMHVVEWISSQPS